MHYKLTQSTPSDFCKICSIVTALVKFLTILIYFYWMSVGKSLFFLKKNWTGIPSENKGWAENWIGSHAYMLLLCVIFTCCVLWCRAPIFAEDILGENGEGEIVQPVERSFWAKYVSIRFLVCLFIVTCHPQAA